mgnify:CR=1 FL=1
MFCSKPQLQPKSLLQKPCLLYLSNWYDYTAWLRTDLQPTNSYCKSSLHYLMGVYWNSFEWSNKVFALLLSFLFEQTNSRWSYLDRVAIKQTKHTYPPLYLKCISLATWQQKTTELLFCKNHQLSNFHNIGKQGPLDTILFGIKRIHK